MIVEINNLFLKSDRGAQIFKNLNFKLSPGRSAVIQGPAGSGKSSLVELLIGLRRPESGSIELFGESIGRLGGMRGRSRPWLLIRDSWHRLAYLAGFYPASHPG